MFTFLFVTFNPNDKNSKTGEQMGGGHLLFFFQDSSPLQKQKLSKVLGLSVPRCHWAPFRLSSLLFSRQRQRELPSVRVGWIIWMLISAGLQKKGMKICFYGENILLNYWNTWYKPFGFYVGSDCSWLLHRYNWRDSVAMGMTLYIW